MAGVSIGTLDGLIIGTVELSFVGLSLELPLGYPLEYPNTGSVLPGTPMGTPIGLWFGYEAARYFCYCLYLTDLQKDNCGEGGIYCVPTSETICTFYMNSVRYLQLLELLTLALSTNWSITSYGVI